MIEIEYAKQSWSQDAPYTKCLSSRHRWTVPLHSCSRWKRQFRTTKKLRGIKRRRTTQN